MTKIGGANRPLSLREQRLLGETFREQAKNNREEQGTLSAAAKPKPEKESWQKQEDYEREMKRWLELQKKADAIRAKHEDASPA